MNIDFFKPCQGEYGPLGVWYVNDKKFYNKREAVLFASSNGCPDIKWSWHDEVWKSFNRDKLGKQSLTDLYKQRAQQLRDKYDYLILCYSGGSDSHNVLMSFLDNDIKLDQVFVHFPFAYINSSQHVPTIKDLSPQNTQSEWDFCVKPTLDYLGKYHPDIKIELSDWGDNINPTFYKDDQFSKLAGTASAVQMTRFLNYSKTGMEQLDKGKTVATIWGFDKPYLGKDNKQQAFMFFNDNSMLLTTNSVGVMEPFYWSPDLPDVAYEMAYQQFLFFKVNPIMQRFMWDRNSRYMHNGRMLLEINREITWDMCYSDTWDKRKFQAGKAQTAMRTDRDAFVNNNKEFDRALDAWKYTYSGFMDGIDKKYTWGDGQARSLKWLNTNFYYIGNLGPSHPQNGP